MKRTLTILLALFLLMIPLAAQAKGPFSYLTVSGGGLKQEVKLTDAGLMDYFAFMFPQPGVEPPANAGLGYELVRHFSDGKTDMAFDHLHYYPDAGFVYYDGLINGYSEYDRKWFAARPEVWQTFEAALKAQTPVSPLPFLGTTVVLIALVALLRRRGGNPR